MDLGPLSIRSFIYGSPTSVPHVQPGSLGLRTVAGTHARLTVRPLPSGTGTAAIDLKETALPGQRWGEVMVPVERSLFRAFAQDPSMGRYLVVLTDVEVLKQSDPVPLTAYRWSRADVETYAMCGIPSRAVDACTVAFYGRANTQILNAQAFQGA